MAQRVAPCDPVLGWAGASPAATCNLLILGRLNASTSARDMNLPGMDLHELRGSRKGTWAVKVSGNWRLTFNCAGKDVDRVDYEDYH